MSLILVIQLASLALAVGSAVSLGVWLLLAPHRERKYRQASVDAYNDRQRVWEAERAKRLG